MARLCTLIYIYEFLNISSAFLIGQGVSPHPPQATYTQCVNPRQVYDCYVSYLEKYAIRPYNVYLPLYAELEKVLRYDLNFVNICRDFDDLHACLSPMGDTCISVQTFNLYTDRFRSYPEAVAYLQNHAFLEYACGAGRLVFITNSNCLTTIFKTTPLMEIMHSCTDTDISGNCQLAAQLTECVKFNVAAQCGPVAGEATCAAATNVLRREEDVDGFCLLDLTQRCSNLVPTLASPLILSFALPLSLIYSHI